MEDKLEANARGGNPQDKPPKPPGDEVASAPEPTPVLHQEDAQTRQDYSEHECGPTIPTPPKRERDGYKTATILLNIFTLVVLVFNAYLVVQAHKLTRNDQRARVGSVDLGVPVIEVGMAPNTAVIVTNHGKTPAVNLEKSLPTSYLRMENIPNRNTQ